MADKDESKIKAEQKELAKEVREELTEQWRKRDYGLRKRENTIMTRISHEDLQFLEALVELEIFKSISETAAFLIHEAIQQKKKMTERILKISDEIKKKKLEAVRALLEGAKEGGAGSEVLGEKLISLVEGTLNEKAEGTEDSKEGTDNKVGTESKEDQIEEKEEETEVSEQRLRGKGNKRGNRH